MPIQQPGRVLLKNIPLQFVAKKVFGHGRKPVDASIPLVPFIDFLITLVVFLLMSFSASGELLAQKANLKMPSAANVGELEVSPVISVDPLVVTLDGRHMADTAALAADPKLERIEPLVQDLDTLKRNWSMLHPQDAFPGKVVLQADVSIDYRVIKKLTYSVVQAGYANISFAVNRNDAK